MNKNSKSKVKIEDEVLRNNTSSTDSFEELELDPELISSESDDKTQEAFWVAED